MKIKHELADLTVPVWNVNYDGFTLDTSLNNYTVKSMYG